MAKNETKLSNLSGVNDMWNYWMASFTAFTWSQEQVEKVMTKFVEQSQLSREEAKKVLEDTDRQVRENQAQLQKLITDSFEMVLSQWGVITKTQQEEVQRKLDQLTEKLDSFKN